MRKIVLLLSALFFVFWMTSEAFAQAQGRQGGQGQPPPPPPTGSGGGTATPRKDPPPAKDPPPPPPAKDPPSSGGSGQATPRKDPPSPPPPAKTPPPANGGSGSGSSGSGDKGRGGSSSGSTAEPRRGSSGSGDSNDRSRGNVPIAGRATPRSPEPPKIYTQWYPIYIGYNQRDVMFPGYNPYRHRNRCWSWGYYNPNYYGYDPSCDPYWWYYPYSSSSNRYSSTSRGNTSAVPKAPATGSIRLRANPNSAQVYVNGVLVGLVDDFDGLTNHLMLEPGFYQLEIRADGYQVFTKQLRVVSGKTVTERISLKKK